MAADTATNVSEILFTHRVQCTEDSINPYPANVENMVSSE